MAGGLVGVQMTMTDMAADQPNPVAITWARRAAVLGGCLLLLALAMMLLPANRTAAQICGRAPDILAFELARTPADIAAIFGPVGSPCARAMTTAMDWINRIDLPFFIGVYFLFLCAVSLSESAQLRQRRWLWGLLFAAVALAGDLLETTLLLQITHGLDDPSGLLPPLVIATWIKWIGLAAFGGLAAYCGVAARPPHWLLAGTGLLTLGVTLAAMVDEARFAAVMPLASGVLWLLLWGRALKASGWIGPGRPV